MAKEANTQEEAAALVAGAGYTNPTNFVQHGHTWHCTATSTNGSSVNLVVDGNSGVHEKTEDTTEVAEPKAGA